MAEDLRQTAPGEDPIQLTLPELRFPVARRAVSLTILAAVVMLFSLGAAVGMSSIAGFGRVLHRLGHFDVRWFAASAAGVAAAFVGYHIAFDRMVWNGDGRGMSVAQRLGVVAAGFGAFVHRGGAALDRYIMRVTGHPRRESDVRLAALQALEMVPISLGATVAAFAALFLGQRPEPPLGFDIPWAIGPIIGTPLALFVVQRLRGRFEHASGWRYWGGVTIDGIALLRNRLLGDPSQLVALVGMTLFAAGELFGVWAAMAAFGYEMSGPAIVLGYGVGYVVSRRSAPLGGAGVIDVMLILALSQAGAPLAAAVAGTFAYRFFNLWCSMPVSLAALSTVRRFSVRRPLSASREPR